MFPPRSRAAFTLTELLVVIAIVAVLAGLLLPMYDRIRETGRATQCLSQMRQVGIACLNYTQDHNGTLPGPCWGGQNAYCRFYYDASGNANDPGGSLPVFLAPYLSISVNTYSTYEPIFMCPTFAKKSPVGNAGTDWVLNTAVKSRSGANVQPFGYPKTSTAAAVPPARLANLNFNPTTTWAITELDRNWYVSDDSNTWYATLPPQKTPLHGGYRNAIFFDFHAGRVTGTNNTPL